MIKKYLLLLSGSFFVLFIFVKGSDAASHAPAAWNKISGGKVWTEFSHQAIDLYGAKLLKTVPTDIKKYCPGYAQNKSAERRAFWVYLLSALAKYESSYNPGVTFDEASVDPTMLTREGKPIISRGLLQISKESANGYGCGIKDAMELHDPKTNITCAVRIFNRWVGRDGVISGKSGGKWRGIARYFSPFRNEKKRSEMARQTAAQPYCKLE